MKIVITDFNNQKFWEENDVKTAELSCMNRICVYPEIKRQTVFGFGGAFTESSAYCYSNLSDEVKDKFINAYFSKEGLSYNIGRTHINSCDFSLSNYAADEDESDSDFEKFSLEREKKYIIPLMREAEKCKGSSIELLLSPWSPPAYMKTNGEMNNGGKLKDEYYDRWAKYMLKFTEEMQKEGFAVRWISVQNEPEAIQTWDSCKYSAKEEAVFAGDYLGPQLEEHNLSDIRILVWDHNKENAYERASEILSYENAEKFVSGIAVHWYTGDHFENLGLIREKYPNKEIVFTEGCVEYSRFGDSNEVYKAEMYAHDMIGNFRNGISAYLDWNLLLDFKGGPNHVGNYCDAPIMCSENFEDIKKNLSYYYIGHFSKYVKRGASVIPVSSYCSELETAAFLNPDGEKVLIVLNRTDAEKAFSAGDKEKGADYVIPPHSIATVIWD